MLGFVIFFLLVSGIVLVIAMVIRIVAEAKAPKRICPHCGALIIGNYSVCQKCGRESKPEVKKMKKCSNCGNQIPEDEETCHICGRKLENKHRWI